MSDMARDADVSVTTAKRWLSIMEASGIVYLLEPYHSNVTKRMVKAPKLYFLDTGLCAYLTEWSSPETLEAGAMSGARYPLEFKKSASPDKSMVRRFELLERLKKPVKEGGVICLSETLLPLTKNASAIPVGLL